MVQTTDTSEAELEALIVRHLQESGYVEGDVQSFDPVYALDLEQLFAFLEETQKEQVEKVKRRFQEETGDEAELTRRAREHIADYFHERLRDKGVLHLLRNPVRDRDAVFRLYYPRPSFGTSFNESAWNRHQANRFSVTRQVRFDPNSNQSLDLALFINGFPLATLELKNRPTVQTVEDAMRQYRGRSPSATLFDEKRCLVHFAVDDQLAYMTTRLEGTDTSFLPFNRGHKGGGGNPPNEDGLKTAYLWEDVLQPVSWDDLITTYVQLEKKEDEHGRVVDEQYVFPRYHQRDAVQKMLVDAEQSGAGERYLIQHSTGSGKSYTMTWLAHQLVELTDPMSEETLFDTVIVVTDRVQLDRQIREYLKQVNRTPGVLQPITKGSQQLRKALEAGKKIITTTIQKFPYIADAIDEFDQSTFAILIDEAHSSQGGSYTGAMHAALSDIEEEEIASHEDAINALIESRKMLPNASYFAFTATPKEKTLELFGREDEEGRLQPFHEYTMKQAIQEGFIMDVLENFTHVESFYRLLKSTDQDVEVVDRDLASRKLRHFAETHDYAREQKAKIMVDHFIDEVIRRGKVDGEARAMVVTKSREEAVRYFWAIKQYLIQIEQKWRPLVAFSDQITLGGEEYTESSLNGFSSDEIGEQFRDPDKPYRFLVVADKFQTGYDEPLLHTMYVDDALGGVQAVQTLSRLNRNHPEKNDTFVLDFQNKTDEIEEAFSDYYTTTVLSERTDPNRLTRLAEQLDEFFVYQSDEVQELTNLYVSGAERDELDPILDRCVERFQEQLTDDEKSDFKSKARSFKRAYSFLSQVITFNVPYWERLYWFVKYLLPKLPTIAQEDRLENVLEHVEMDSYRVQKEAVQTISPDDAESELEPASNSGGGTNVHEPRPDYLSNIVDEFNARFGDIDWTDKDKVRRFIFEELPEDLATNEEFVEKVRSSDPQNARITVDEKVIEKFQELIMSHTELYKEFTDNPDFQNFVQEAVFQKVYAENE